MRSPPQIPFLEEDFGLKSLVVVTLLILLGFWYLQSTLMLAFLPLIIAVGLSLPVRFLLLRGWGYG